MKLRHFLIAIVIFAGLTASVTASPVGTRKDLKKDLLQITITSEQVKLYVDAAEAKVPHIRPENASQVYYANKTLRNQTEYCLLYLHGFSASPMEGDAMMKKLAETFGMNVYMPRLADHGLDIQDPLLNMTPENLWESVLESIVLAKALGKKVIIAGTSGGGTLALQAAASFPQDVYALLLYSPCVRIATPGAWILGMPLGLQLGRMITGGKYRILSPDPKTDPYWYKKYRVEGVVYLQKLINWTMKTKTFEAVKQPVFTGYYYQDEEHQDQTVKVKATRWMADHLATPADRKMIVNFPDGTDHVICFPPLNPNWMKVYQASADFMTETLGIIPTKK